MPLFFYRPYVRARLSAAFFLCLFATVLGGVDACAAESNARAIADSTLRVSDIVFIGNDLTKDYVIEREMSLRPGAFITDDAIRYDTDRIYSLQLFTRVNIIVLPIDTVSARLEVVVNERWYFYPYPVLGLKDHDWSHLFYGLGVVDNNVGGHAVQTALEFALGYDPYVMLSLFHPSISTDNALFLSSHCSYSVQKNKSLLAEGGGPNFDERRTSVDAGLGRRFTLFSTASLAAQFFRLTVSDNRAGRTISPDGTDQFLALDAGYKYDTRDLIEYPKRGTFLKADYVKYGLGGAIDFERYAVDYRRYIPTFGDIVMTGRAFGNIAAGGRVPNYAHVYFGYTDRIRGHYNEILEGDNILGTSAELHIPLLSPRYYRLTYMPIEQFRDIRYALNVALFADAGTVWYKNQSPTLHNVTSGFGAGLHLLFAYSIVVRCEYAFQENFRSGQAIFDVGTAF